MARTGKIPVLLVDDRRENLIALEELLSELPLDLELTKANSGQEALRYGLKNEFALILLDVQMPDMDGLETAELLRINRKTRHQPIIFVTAGMGELGHMFKGYELGAVDYLIKPIDPVILRSKVRTFCELYAQRAEIEYGKANLELQVSERTAELSALAARLTEEIKVRQAAEEALRESEARMRQVLEKRIEERTRELKAAMEQIVESEKLASLGRVVAGVAHELNTPIGNIVTIASTLAERIKEIGKSVREGKLTKLALENAVEECKAASITIVRSSQYAGELVESFKKVAVDTASQRRRSFDLRDTMADIVNTLGAMMRQAHVTSDLQIPHGIKMDSFPGCLEQIFSNLILNSIHHGFEDRQGGHIEIAGRTVDGSVEIVYRDDGKGIAPEFHRKVFEPFYTTKLGQGGSGLGMFIVYNLAHGALKGDIRLESETGKGVAFTLTMPVVTPCEA